MSTSPQKCAHHWLIDPPNGPQSRGTCRHCGGERLFKNSLPDSLYDYERKRPSHFFAISPKAKLLVEEDVQE